jgi:hypothetical protein
MARSGIAFHHAGLDVSDRRDVEANFLGGSLSVIVSTSVGKYRPTRLMADSRCRSKLARAPRCNQGHCRVQRSCHGLPRVLGYRHTADDGSSWATSVWQDRNLCGEHKQGNELKIDHVRKLEAGQIPKHDEFANNLGVITVGADIRNKLTVGMRT